ncbi:MAG: MATE family efflux transporter [Clostridia bacterium]|nr:MATE family efflux transporter [Clostridia bacterium]
MTTQPVEGLIGKLAIPTIISMLVITFYNLADTYFVGKINTSATGAVGVVFSFTAILQAVGFFFGHGSGNFISKALGSGQQDKAERMAATGFFLSIAAGAVIGLLSFIFLEPLSRLLGATDTILPYAKSYLRYILIGSPFITSSFVLNNQLRFQGNAMFAMVGIGAGSVINIALDPLFMFKFSMGIAGAAIATVLSQIISFFLLVGAILKSDSIKIKPRLFTPTKEYISEIFRGGIPSLARQGLAGVSTIFLNNAAGVYGDAAVAAMSVVSRITMFAFSALIGFGQGFQPVCGFNYGAGKFERVKKSFWFCIKVSAIFLTVVAIVGFCAAPVIIGRFRDDPEVIKFGAIALRAQMITLPLMSWVVISNMMLQNIGKVYRASFLGMARHGIFLIPIVLVLPSILGIYGILYAQFFSDILSVCCAIPIQMTVLKELDGKIEQMRK